MAAPLVLNVVKDLIVHAVQQARSEGTLQLETMPEIQVERPANPQHGDLCHQPSFAAGAGHPG